MIIWAATADRHGRAYSYEHRWPKSARLIKLWVARSIPPHCPQSGAHGLHVGVAVVVTGEGLRMIVVGTLRLTVSVVVSVGRIVVYGLG